MSLARFVLWLLVGLALVALCAHTDSKREDSP